MMEKMMFLQEEYGDDAPKDTTPGSDNKEKMVKKQEDIMGEINQSRMDVKTMRSDDDPSL